jgi:FMN phosphatase YigB (HAD superfamily)
VVSTWQTAILIDLDGTLIEGPFERAVWPVILGELARKTGLSLQAARDQIVEENARRQSNPAVPAVQAMDWDDIVATVAGRLGVRLESRLLELVESNAVLSCVLDHGDHVLRELRQPERALVVATKGLARYQKPVLDALGLTPLFDDILTPDVYGALKSSRAFFGGWPERVQVAMMVGDRYDDDILYPGSYGLKTIWKPETIGWEAGLAEQMQAQNPFARARLFPYQDDQPVAADALILSLEELPAVVKQVEQMALESETKTQNLHET